MEANVSPLFLIVIAVIIVVTMILVAVVALFVAWVNRENETRETALGHWIEDNDVPWGLQETGEDIGNEDQFA